MEARRLRRKTKEIKIGNTLIGGNAPVAVQSMTNTDSLDFDATYNQIKAAQAAGCDIIRMAFPEADAAKTLYQLKCSDIAIPIVADIHFSSKLAILAAEAGADKIRINPGNIGDDDRVKAVADICRLKNIPIRVGVNSGSLEKELLALHGAPTAEALAASALENVKLLERFDFDNIVVAIKASDVWRMVEANRIVASRCDYPLHLGVTEAGSEALGTVKSAMGIGSLLLDGIGDTLRVSLTADPVREIEKGRAILSALGLDQKSKIDLVSCPTCGRTKIDLIPLVAAFEKRMDELNPIRRLKVAIMGCAVNGPGEARDADLGIAGGVGEALLFSHGEIVKKIPEDKIVDTLIAAINNYRD
ncbi:MAG: flavodoxin-dependent (E)-4-hydroxy-3-methylbut-2-enyl-diphosphate synthase [Clostridia bacterium]|nr:flavodoxin-dependent (E)-4-hydroxy-3-methylbut-2-enyl-diphosphate synthase [Clostridia bacterium]